MADDHFTDEPQERVRVALFGVVQAVHGQSDAEAAARIRSTIEALQRASAAMAAYPLTNADEPDPIFAVYRAE